MKVTIRGNNPVTSDDVKYVIDTLNKDYKDLGVKVKNMTMYVRFITKSVKPLPSGMGI